MTGKTLARWVSGLLLACCACAPAAQADFVVKGTVKCALTPYDKRPLADTQIVLWDDNVINDEITTTYTDANGRYRFDIDTESKKYDADNGDEVYLSINLTTKSHDVEVYRFSDAWNGPANVDTDSKTANKNKTVTINSTWVGGLSGFESPKCAQFLGARAALADYRKTTGTGGFAYDITVGYPSGGVPYTIFDETKWPTGYSTKQHGGEKTAGYDVSYHEFAHAVRARFDGDEGHFYLDAASFQYPQYHSLCKRTNAGFAFNEGWAEFMAYVSKKDGCGADKTTLDYEGIVANRLKTFSETCASRKTMIDVLRRNKGRIHTMFDYEARLEQLVPACAKVARQATMAQAEVGDDPEPAPDPEKLEARTTAEITALLTQASALRAEAEKAQKAADDPPSCRSRTACTGVAVDIAAPTVLAAQADAAEAAAKLLSDELAAAKSAGFTPTAESEQAQQGRLRTYNAAVGTTLNDAARTARSQLSGSVKGRSKAYFTAAKAVAQRLAVRGRTQPGLRPLPPAVLPTLETSDSAR